MPNRTLRQPSAPLMTTLRHLLASVTLLSVTAVAAPTVTISANPANVSSGSPSTPTWSSTEATSCAASGDWSGIKAASGNQSVIAGSAPVTRTYTLTCSSSGGAVSQSVTVSAQTAGSITLMWDGPTTDADNTTPLTDLAGYRIYRAAQTAGACGPFSQILQLIHTTPGSSVQTTLTNVAAGTHCFTVTAYDTQGGESAVSNQLLETIN